jgi:TIR domain
LPDKVSVFISYAREDTATARRLFAELQRMGADPWLDSEKVLPGQRWKVAIKEAIRSSRYFIALLSANTVTKRGVVQSELNQALEILDEFPEADIFVIPVRVDDCAPSHGRLRELNWVDLFPSFSDGLQKIQKLLVPGNSHVHAIAECTMIEFTMIRLFSGNQRQGSESWKEVDDGKFERQYEFAADPVFDVMVKNKSRITLTRVGIRILQRMPGKGGIFGYGQSVEVQSEFRVLCPQEWKQTWGPIDDKIRWTDFAAPIEMKEGDSPFRFTLMLKDFCDIDSASCSEVKFYLLTDEGTAESRSNWLSQ